MDESENPIVAMATKLRARRDLGAAIDSATADAVAPRGDDAEARFAALGEVLAVGSRRLNSILGRRTGVTVVKLDNPPRLRLRFRDKRIALDLDAVRQLVIVAGAGLDGEYQFLDGERPGADEPLEVLDGRRLPRRADGLGPAQDDLRGRADPAPGPPGRTRPDAVLAPRHLSSSKASSCSCAAR